MARPKVLLAHVPYDQSGGEDQHVHQLAQAYEAIGVEVKRFPAEANPDKSLRAVGRSLGGSEPLSFWEACEGFEPAMIHLHNIFPTLGPSFLRELVEKKIAAVATAHNHRIFCSNGLAFRAERPCDLCVDAKVLWRPVIYNCNKSYAKSAYYSLALTQIRSQALWHKAISGWIAPSPYMRQVLERQGIASARIMNILHPVEFSGAPASERYWDFVYAGRLAPEKGVGMLLDMVPRLPRRKFLILGDGPLSSRVAEMRKQNANLDWQPDLPREAVLDRIKLARAGVLLSAVRESFSLFSYECFTAGLNLLVPSFSATSWLTAEPCWGQAVDTSNPEAVRAALEAIAQKPLPEISKVEELRQQVNPAMFAANLRKMIGAFGGIKL